MKVILFTLNIEIFGKLNLEVNCLLFANDIFLQAIHKAHGR